MKLNRIALAAAVLAGAQVWLGSPDAYTLVLDAADRVTALQALGPDALQSKLIELRGSNSADPFALPDLHSVQDGVGVLDISGPMVTGSSGFMRLFGVVGYDDIRDAANELMADPKVKSILLHVNSPGGSAAGCEECAAHLKAIGALKPMVTYSSSMMASGGYWLGSVSQKILTSKTAVLGSIGVLITAVSVAKANEQAGRDVKIIRIGEYKQPYNPNEALSEKAIAHLTSQGEDMYAIFRGAIAANLGLDEKKFDATVGLGREFMGQKAVDAGLAQGIATYDEAFAVAKSVDKLKAHPQNSRNSKGTPMKVTLSTALLVMLASGVAATKLDLSTAAATAEGVVPDAEGLVSLQSQAIVAENALKAGRETAVADATKPLTEKVTELTASLGVANTELSGLRTTSAALTEKTQSLEAAVTATEKVLRSSIGVMCGQLKEADKSEGLKSVELVAEHDRIEKLFAAKFPGAKVSALSAKADTDALAATATPLWAQVALQNGKA